MVMPILLQAKDRDGMPSHIEVLSQTKLSMRGGDLVHAIPVWRELAPGYAAPAEFTYTEDVNAGQPAALLHMRVDDNRLVCEGVTIRPPRGRSLRGSDLR